MTVSIWGTFLVQSGKICDTFVQLSPSADKIQRNNSDDYDAQREQYALQGIDVSHSSQSA